MHELSVLVSHRVVDFAKGFAVHHRTRESLFSKTLDEMGESQDENVEALAAALSDLEHLEDRGAGDFDLEESVSFRFLEIQLCELEIKSKEEDPGVTLDTVTLEVLLKLDEIFNEAHVRLQGIVTVDGLTHVETRHSVAKIIPSLGEHCFLETPAIVEMFKGFLEKSIEGLIRSEHVKNCGRLNLTRKAGLQKSHKLLGKTHVG